MKQHSENPMYSSLLQIIVLYLKDLDEKTTVLFKNIVYNGVLKIVNLGVVYLTIPLLLNYLSAEKYGMWITLMSVVVWIGISDLGLGNGLKNKLTQHIALNEIESSQKVISIVYSFMIGIAFVVSIVFFVGLKLINWNIVFNVSSHFSEPLLPVVLVFGIGTLWILVLKLIYNVYYAHQRNFVTSVIDTSVQILTFLGLLGIKTYTQKLSLFNIAVLFFGVQIISLLFVNLLTFRHYKFLTPTLGFSNFNEAKPLLKVSMLFSWTQLMGCFLFLSDNILITHFFGSESVASYNICFRYFGMIGVIGSLTYASIWTMTTKAFAVNDLLWIKKTIHQLYLLSLLTSMIAFILLLFANQFYQVWIGSKIGIPFLLSVSVCFYWCVTSFSQGMMSVINGIGKLKVQVWLSFVLAFLNILLIVVFAKFTTLGVAGVPLATGICLLLQIIVIQIQLKNILSGNASGIWNQ